MGNCLQASSSRRGHGGGGGEQYCAKKRAVWAEEKVTADEGENTCRSKSGPPAPAPMERVKITISRKHLEELLQRVDDRKQQDDGGGVPARVVVAELLSDASSSNFGHRGSQEQWRPSLQSIPE